YVSSRAERDAILRRNTSAVPRINRPAIGRAIVPPVLGSGLELGFAGGLACVKVGVPDEITEPGVHCALSVSAPSESEPEIPVGTPATVSACGSVIDGNVSVRPVTEAVANFVVPFVDVECVGWPIASFAGVKLTPATLLSTEDSVFITPSSVLVSEVSGVNEPSTLIEPTVTVASAVGTLAATADVATLMLPSAASGSVSPVSAPSTALRRFVSAVTSACS